jgi:DNA-binding CsgD family transcriptional regulator
LAWKVLQARFMRLPPSARATSAPDLASIVEAAYAVDGSAQEWAARILGAAHRSLGAGRGGFTCELQLNEDGTLAIDRGSAAVIRHKAERLSALFESLPRALSGFLALQPPAGRTAGRCVLTSEMAPGALLPSGQRVARQVVSDELNIFCLDPDRRGFLLSLEIRDRRKLTPELRDDLHRVATHILTGLRLRRRLRLADADTLAERDSTCAGGEAALAEARRALQAAVLNVERALTPLRTGEAPALDEGKKLIATGWMLIHQVDAQGARYIVARQPTTSARLSLLTPTERRVVVDAARGSSTKEISYELGIAEATVRVLIMRASRRLGVRTRDELLVLARTQRP